MQNSKIGGLDMSECPKCGGTDIATIFWGYPGNMDWYLQAIKNKEIVAGGCLIGNDDPKLKCNDCGWRY